MIQIMTAEPEKDLPYFCPTYACYLNVTSDTFDGELSGLNSLPVCHEELYKGHALLLLEIFHQRHLQPCSVPDADEPLALHWYGLSLHSHD